MSNMGKWTELIMTSEKIPLIVKGLPRVLGHIKVNGLFLLFFAFLPAVVSITVGDV